MLSTFKLISATASITCFRDISVSESVVSDFAKLFDSWLRGQFFGKGSLWAGHHRETHKDSGAHLAQVILHLFLHLLIVAI